MKPGLAVLAVLTLIAAAAGAPAAERPVDAVVAEFEGGVVTASEIALARALGLFGFQSSGASIDRADVERLLQARLVVGEARLLGIGPDAAELEAAWQASAASAGGPAALDAWLDRHGVERAWARALVEDDARWRRFIELRFRAFVFVSEAEVGEALGPGEHDAEARARTRRDLETRAVAERLREWLRETAARRPPTLLLAPDAPVGCPLPMPGDTDGILNS